MCFRHFGGILRQNKNQVHWVGPGYILSLNLFQGIRLVYILGGTLENGLEARSILQLLVGIGILMRL